MDLERLDCRILQKFTGLASALAVVSISRLGSDAISVIHAFSSAKAFTRARKIPRARTKLLSAVADICELARVLEPLPISRFFTGKKKWIIYSDAAVEPSKSSPDTFEVSLGGVLLEYDQDSRELKLMDAFFAEAPSYSKFELENGLTGIQALEAKAMILAWKIFSKAHGIETHEVIDFRVDNLADVYAAIKTTGGSPSAATYLDLIRYFNRSANWTINYVASKRNLADWCTRAALEKVSLNSDPLIQQLRKVIRKLEYDELDSMIVEAIKEMPEKRPITKRLNDSTEEAFRESLKSYFEEIYIRDRRLKNAN
jgi:hypothetical protein